MIIFNKIEDIQLPFETCVTVGNFDGVHRGHQTLIKKAVDYSRKHNLKSVVFTFSNHPVNYFKPGYVKNIMSNEEKEGILESLGIDVLLNIPFDEAMTKISAEDYVRKIIVDRLHAKKMIVGHDFTFARKREGNSALLKEFGKEFGFDVEIVTPVLLDGDRISSTKIRSLITEGNVIEAEHLLGRYYSIEGTVIKARQIGRTIGFPTANISYDTGRIIPHKGIYATLVTVDGVIYCGATSIGTNPTVNGKGITIETYILDFDRNIYGKMIKVEFVERMRDEIKFDSVDGLVKQLQKDVNYVRANYVKCLESSMNSHKTIYEKIDDARKKVNSKNIKNRF